MGYWGVVDFLIKNADILVLIIDARMPELSKNAELEKKALKFNKEIVIVCNKIDLIGEESLIKLKKENPNWFFVSGTNNINVSELKRGLQIMAKKMKIDNPKIGFVGYPNVGKSSVINALAHRARAVVSPIAGTTRGTQWIRVSNLKIIDSPGVIPSEDKNTKLGLIAAKNPEKISNPEKVAVEIINLFLKENAKALQEHYKLSEEQMKKEDYEILSEIGRKRGYLSRGGIVDETKTAITIIREWQKGKLGMN